ncbi:MAG: hypothetical protein M1381_09580 [Deltaproteobacteria bacterium]|nr:hypothetical protein [Deltaproteobacteria bacterium]MCL5792637.1 hypothetical protein [Deltaproteobacteria bacterium]
MRQRVIHFSIIILSLFFLTTRCATSKVNPYQNTHNADQIIMNGGLNNSSQISEAQSLYTDALNNINPGDSNYAYVESHANFGLGMIGIWNAISTISSLLSSNMLGSLTGGSSSNPCQPIDITPYQNLLGPILDNIISPIVSNLKAVLPFTGFSFTINSADLVILNNMSTLGINTSSLTDPRLYLDMSGTYDLGEVDSFIGLLETIQGGVKLLFAYNGVANALINLVIPVKSGCPAPQSPLLDPAFGTISSNGAQELTDAQSLLGDAFKSFGDSASFIMNRKGDNSNHVLMFYDDWGGCPSYFPQCQPKKVVLSFNGLNITMSIPASSISEASFNKCPDYITDSSKFNLYPAGDNHPCTSQDLSNGTPCGYGDGIREISGTTYVEDVSTTLPNGVFMPGWEQRNPAVNMSTVFSPGPDDTGIDGLFNVQETGYNADCNPDPDMNDAFPPNFPWLIHHQVPIMVSGIPFTEAEGSGVYEPGKRFHDWGTDNTPDQLETGPNGCYRGLDPKGDLYDPVKNPMGTDGNGHYDPGEPWGSPLLSQLLVVALQILPAIVPSLSSTLSPVSILISGMNRKRAAAFIDNLLFIQGISLPIGVSNVTIPPLSKIIYLTDISSTSYALQGSILDTNGQHPLDLYPVIGILLKRLLGMVNGISYSGSPAITSMLGGLLPVLTNYASAGTLYTLLPGVLPSIDLGAFFNYPPGNLKTLAPLYYPQATPFVDKAGTGIYVPPEPFADGFVHVPDPAYNNGAGYWTATASLVNGTCDNCVGNPFTAGYGGEWYSDSTGKYVQWESGDPIDDIYGDGQYHNAGDIIVQYDEEQTFPFVGKDWQGLPITAFSDTGTGRVADNLELGYSPTNNPDPYGDDITCTNPPYPFPDYPQQSWSVCGEKNGIYDGYDGNFMTLLSTVSGTTVAPFSGSYTPFVSRYHFWPDGRAVDPPTPVMFSGMGINLLVFIPDDTYVFFPDPSFDGVLTMGHFHWGTQYSSWLGIADQGTLSCGTTSYSTMDITNGKVNQFVGLVSLLINSLTSSL